MNTDQLLSQHRQWNDKNDYTSAFIRDYQTLRREHGIQHNGINRLHRTTLVSSYRQGMEDLSASKQSFIRIKMLTNCYYVHLTISIQTMLEKPEQGFSWKQPDYHYLRGNRMIIKMNNAEATREWKPKHQIPHEKPGDISLILGIKVERTESTPQPFQLHIRFEVKTLKKKSGMWECKSMWLPRQGTKRRHPFDPDQTISQWDKFWCNAMAGKTTRPDMTIANPWQVFRNTQRRYMQKHKSTMTFERTSRLRHHILQNMKSRRWLRYGDATWKSDQMSNPDVATQSLRAGAAVVWDSKHSKSYHPLNLSTFPQQNTKDIIFLPRTDEWIDGPS
jgi:hypothetical protein